MYFFHTVEHCLHQPYFEYIGKQLALCRNSFIKDFPYFPPIFKTPGKENRIGDIWIFFGIYGIYLGNTWKIYGKYLGFEKYCPRIQDTWKRNQDWELFGQFMENIWNREISPCFQGKGKGIREMGKCQIVDFYNFVILNIVFLYSRHKKSNED